MVLLKMDGIDLKNNGKWEYDITELGYKYNLTDSAAAFVFGRCNMLMNGKKEEKELVVQYHEGVKGIGGILLPNICDACKTFIYYKIIE